MKPFPSGTRILRAAALLVFAASSLAQAASSRSWSIEPLGAFGDRGSLAASVNNRGEVAGNSAVTHPDGSFFSHAFVWRSGVMEDIGASLGTPPGAAFSNIIGMNDAGTLVGNGPDGVMTWRNGEWTALGFRGSARGINNAGAIVGTIAPGNGAQAPFLYRDGVLHELPSLGGRLASAAAVNSSGLVIGTSQVGDNLTNHAFIYKDGVMRDLGTLGGQRSTGVDVNDQGVVIGNANDAEGRLVAFATDEGGVLRRLIPDLADNHSAAAMNQRGDVVGNTDFSSFLYAGGEVTILESLPAVQAAGWWMLFPLDINDRGWIVGWGWRFDGPFDGEAFLLKPN